MVQLFDDSAEAATGLVQEVEACLQGLALVLWVPFVHWVVPCLPSQTSDLYSEFRKAHVPLYYRSKLLEVYEIVQDFRSPDLTHLSSFSKVDLGLSF